MNSILNFVTNIPENAVKSVFGALRLLIENEQISAAFFGAFFAFIFFLFGEFIKERISRNKICRNEHAFLERYFYDLKITLLDNKITLENILEGYKTRVISLERLSDLPTRDGASMKVVDKLFINRLETYVNHGVNRLNRWQRSLGEFQNKLNEDFTCLDRRDVVARAEVSLAGFLEEAGKIIKFYNYFLKNLEALIFENRILLKEYGNWFFIGKQINELYRRRKTEIEQESKKADEIVSPLVKEQEDNLREFGIID